MKSVLLGTLVNSIFGFQRNLNHDRVAEIDISKVATPEKLDDKTLNRILNEFKVDKELFSILTDVIDGKNIEIDDELLARVGRNESLKNVIMQSMEVSDDIKKALHQYGRYSSGRFKYVAPRSAKLPNDIKNAKSYSTALDRVGKPIFNIRNDEEFLVRKEMYKELMLSGNCTTEDYNTIINDILGKTDDVEFKKMVLSGIEDKNLDSFALRNLGSALLHEPDVSIIEYALEHFNPNLLCHQFGKETQFPLGTLYRFYPTFTDKMGDALLKHSSELAYLKEEDARVFSSFLAKTVKMPDNFYKGMILQLGDKALTFETMPYSVCEWYVKKRCSLSCCRCIIKNTNKIFRTN